MQEGQTGIVTITAFEKCDIETMLVFLYAGGTSQVSLRIPMPTMLTDTKAGPLAYLGFDMRQTYQPASGAPGALYIRIWKTADFFCLEELKTIAVDKFTNYNNIFLPAISLNGPTISTKVTQHLVNCARLIWTETREDLRAIFGSIVLGTLLGGICYFYKTEEFKNLIKEVPDFASQWALSLTAVVGSAGAPEKRAKQCAKCHKASAVEGGCIDVLGWMKEGGSLKTFCTTCIPLPNVQEWKEIIEETS